MAEPSLAPCSGCANTMDTAVAGFCLLGLESDERHFGVEVVRSRIGVEDMEAE